jgi:hypothetical protein
MGTATIRFTYTSRNNRDDLTDVVITIVNDSGDVQVNAASMTHRSFGTYTYDFTASTTGWYHAQMSSLEELRTVSDSQYADTTPPKSISSISTSSNLKYATTLQLSSIIGIRKEVPSWDVSATPSKEEVGTGNGVLLSFFLDHQSILEDSYTLYYGATESAATNTLTKTTHYSINLTTGEVTLTLAGRTLLSTNKLYVKYSYISNGMTDEYLTTVLARAEQRVDDACGTTFTDGTQDNPSYPSHVDFLPSKGIYNIAFFTDRRPLIDVNSTLGTTITDADVTLDVSSGDGVLFPSAGTIILGTEIITYTGITVDTLTGLSRGVDGSTVAAHTAGDEIHSTVVQISGTGEGSAPTWYPQEWKADVFVEDTGRFTLYNVNLIEGTTGENLILPQEDVQNRVKITYLYGYDSIPATITRLTLLIAKQQLISDTVGKALIAGRNEFRPEMVNVDQPEIDSIIKSYNQASMSNT